MHSLCSSKLQSRRLQQACTSTVPMHLHTERCLSHSDCAQRLPISSRLESWMMQCDVSQGLTSHGKEACDSMPDEETHSNSHTKSSALMPVNRRHTFQMAA